MPLLGESKPDGLAFEQAGHDYLAKVELTNETVDSDLEIVVPMQTREVLVERASDGGVYFCIHTRGREATRVLPPERLSASRSSGTPPARASRLTMRPRRRC